MMSQDSHDCHNDLFLYLFLFRLNAVTGWCGQQEAFTYVSVDLGSIHRVKAILVKVRGRGGVTVPAVWCRSCQSHHSREYQI